MPLQDLRRLVAAAPETFFRSARSVELPGGLRSRTFLQTFRAAYVAKFGSLAELERQRSYVEALPSPFDRWFPRFLGLSALDSGRDAGVAILELVPGRTLHDYLWDGRIAVARRLAALRAVLDRLRELHRHPVPEATIVRDAEPWLERVLRRLPDDLDRTARRRITEAVARVRQGAPPPAAVPASLLHGDAQCGNFLVTEADGRIEVRFLDPLGGSGEARGDYVYDLSRLFHWTDGAASCFEREKARPRPETAVAKNVAAAASAEVRAALAEEALLRRDGAADFWFELYAAFHLSGKLRDFRREPSRRRLAARLTGCLARAVDLSPSLSQGAFPCRSSTSA